MLSRRNFLKVSGLTLASLTACPPFLTRLAHAVPAPGSRPKVLVTIFLRGAVDSLMAVPPLADPALRRFRPKLGMSGGSLSGDGLLDLDGRYGLHPALAPLYPFWEEGRLAILHGVGSPNPTRSHFDAQEFMEAGTPWRKSTPSGWLNRLSAVAPGPASPFRSVAITSDLPRSLYGDAAALAAANLSTFRLFSDLGPRRVGELTRTHLDQLYRGAAAGDLEQNGHRLFDGIATLTQKDLVTYLGERGKLYPKHRLAIDLIQIAFLIKANVGLQIAFAELNGWDTHVGQGTLDGPFADRSRHLAESLAAFWNDLEGYHDDVVVLTLTEFGRRVAENGSGGTDHGYGATFFALGNRVDGGKVHGEIPPLEPELLFEGRDLPVTIDFRSVLSEVSGKLLGVVDDGAVFPGWSGPRLPLLRY